MNIGKNTINFLLADGNNIITIRDTVLAILTHNFSALRCSNGTVTPMRMLIKHMPGTVLSYLLE